MEATTVFEGLEIHILGYGFNMADPGILEFINNTAIIRYDREIGIVKAAMKAFDGLSLTEFHEFSKRDYSGGFASLNYLVDKGKVADLKDFGDKKKAFMPEDREGFAPTAEAAKILKEAGALIAVAHPSYHFPNSVMPEEMLSSFARMGIDGIECRSPYNSGEAQIAYYESYAARHKMARSAGSDCHGAYLARRVGTPYADARSTVVLEWLEGKGLGVARFRRQTGK
jgi:predicted metal-dependent phosphoesterase TrpH